MSCSFRGLHASVLYAEFPANTPERIAFKALLAHVSRALREIERAEDGEPSAAEEAQAIRECLSLSASAPVRPGGLAAACRPVIEGYEAGLSALDGDMLQRLVDLGDQAAAIADAERRLLQTVAALRSVLTVFDNHENRDPERRPREFAVLQGVYQALGRPWPANGSRAAE